MIRLVRIASLCILLTFLFIEVVTASSDSTAISRDVVDSLAQQYEYLDTETKWRLRDDLFETSKLKGPRWDFDFANMLKGLIGLIGFGLLAALIVFGVLAVLKRAKKVPAKAYGPVDLDHITNIEEVDLESLLTEALTRGDYRLAFRIQFLQVIQHLTISRTIEYKPYKTNRAYTREMQESPLRDPFRQLASLFERLWYGQQPLDKQQYDQLQRYFLDLKPQQRAYVG